MCIEDRLPVERVKKSSLPITTLKDRVHGRVNIDTVKSGPSPLFSAEQEAFCFPVKVLRRNDSFKCPECSCIEE